MQLDAVLLDLDDTLCRYRRSGSEFLDAAFERTGTEMFITREEYHARYPEFVDESDAMTDLRERCFAATAEAKGLDPALGRRVARAYADERDHDNVEPLPGLRSAVEAVSSLSLGLVTNGSPEMQAPKLEAIGLADAFDVVVHAGYDAPAKPDPGPFETALSELDAGADRTVHVDNSLESDVAGAQAASVGSVWIAGTDAEVAPAPKPDHTVTSLEELPAVLELE